MGVIIPFGTSYKGGMKRQRSGNEDLRQILLTKKSRFVNSIQGFWIALIMLADRVGFFDQNIAPGMGVSKNSKDESGLWRKTSLHSMGQ